MLLRESKQGVDLVVLTPHFYAHRDSPARFLKRRKQAVAELKQHITGRSKIPTVITGAEVAYFRGMSRVEDIERLRIRNTDAMLVEMPFCRWDRNMIDDLFFLKESRGVRPILAHIERYIYYQPLGTVRMLCEAGIWIQASASFFTSWKTAWLAMRMLKKRKIHFIGSDCHNTTDRPPNMGEAISRIEKRLGEDAVRYLKCMERRLLGGGVR
ncbi:MAG: hypothetical protein IKJ65_09885 [Clostridia bacterium]|nr:hypothetical protein [Clostridia bacterium]